MFEIVCPATVVVGCVVITSCAADAGVMLKLEVVAPVNRPSEMASV